MKINIEKAEEVVSYCGTDKKSALIQKKLLFDIIQQVKSKRQWIENYKQTVKIISKTHQNKKQELEQLIHQLVDREQTLYQGLVKISNQQKELEKRQLQLKQELDTIRAHAEKCRDKKVKCEQQYHTVASLPILSMQSKKRYLKARDKNLEAEQQVSEMRFALDKCREHLRLISKTLSAQNLEQDHISNQRRGSIDAIKSTSQQLHFLKKGYEFWEGFDTYQAKVVLESATYLHELDLSVKNKPTTDLDMNQVWIKTFLLACFEYGDREVYGDTQWSPETIKINFECSLCQTAQLGWPRVAHKSELACEFCYNTTKTPPIPTASLPMKHKVHDSKMKKFVSHLFSTHSKINPIM